MIQFSENAEVLNANKEKLGTIDRIVINPDTNDVSHVVVKRGLLDTEKKIIPIDLFEYVSEDQVIFQSKITDLDEFTDFEETHFFSYDFEAEGKESKTPFSGRHLYWYPPVGGIGSHVTLPFGVKTDKNIPKSTVALETGAKVISKNDENVGDIESVFVDPDTNQATHFLISSGFFSKTKKLIPVYWIKTTLEKEVHLFVNSNVIEKLPEYREEN